MVQYRLPGTDFWNVLDPPPEKHFAAGLGLLIRSSVATREGLEEAILDYCTLSWLSSLQLAQALTIRDDLSWVIEEIAERFSRYRVMDRRWRARFDDTQSCWEYRTAENVRISRILREGIDPESPGNVSARQPS